MKNLRKISIIVALNISLFIFFTEKQEAFKEEKRLLSIKTHLVNQDRENLLNFSLPEIHQLNLDRALSIWNRIELLDRSFMQDGRRPDPKVLKEINQSVEFFSTNFYTAWRNRLWQELDGLRSLVKENNWRRLGYQTDLIVKDLESRPEAELHKPSVYENFKPYLREMTSITMGSSLSMDKKRTVLERVAGVEDVFNISYEIEKNYGNLVRNVHQIEKMVPKVDTVQKLDQLFQQKMRTYLAIFALFFILNFLMLVNWNRKNKSISLKRKLPALNVNHLIEPLGLRPKKIKIAQNALHKKIFYDDRIQNGFSDMINSAGKDKIVSLEVESLPGKVLLTARFRGGLNQDFIKQSKKWGSLAKRMAKVGGSIETSEHFDLKLKQSRFEIETELPEI